MAAEDAAGVRAGDAAVAAGEGVAAAEKAAAVTPAAVATGDAAVTAPASDSRPGPVAGAGPGRGPADQPVSPASEPVCAAGCFSSQAGLATFRPWPVEVVVMDAGRGQDGSVDTDGGC